MVENAVINRNADSGRYTMKKQIDDLTDIPKMYFKSSCNYHTATNIRLGWKGLHGTNDLSYFASSYAKKRIIEI